MVRIGIRCRPILGHVHRALDPPRPRPDELLAWHRCEGSDDRVGRHSGREAQFLGVPAARLTDRPNHLPCAASPHGKNLVISDKNIIKYRRALLIRYVSLLKRGSRSKK